MTVGISAANDRTSKWTLVRSGKNSRTEENLFLALRSFIEAKEAPAMSALKTHQQVRIDTEEVRVALEHEKDCCSRLMDKVQAYEKFNGPKPPSEDFDAWKNAIERRHAVAEHLDHLISTKDHGAARASPVPKSRSKPTLINAAAGTVLSFFSNK